jgi:hypothetical protein
VALSNQGSNIEAIARYIGGQEPARTPAAIAVRDEWQRFYSGLGDFEKNFEQQAYDRARNLRLKFNRANAVTPEQVAAVEEQALRGVTTEEMAGEADRRTADGSYIPPPSGSTTAAHALIAVGAVVAIVLLLRR